MASQHNIYKGILWFCGGFTVSLKYLPSSYHNVSDTVSESIYLNYKLRWYGYTVNIQVHNVHNIYTLVELGRPDNLNVVSFSLGSWIKHIRAL